jgi:O-antigen/teichoic acid export membrane protein
MSGCEGRLVRDLRFLPARLSLERIRRDSLFRNSLYIMATTVLTSALGLAYWTTVARTYDPRAVGLSAALVSAMMLASAFSTFGLSASLVHRLPRRQSRDEWSATVLASLSVGLVTSTVGTTIAIVALPLFSARFASIRSDPFLAATFALGVLLTTLSSVIDYVFVAERKAGSMLVRNVAFSLVKIPIAAAAPLFFTASASAVVDSWVIGLAAGFVVSLLLLARLGRASRVAARSAAREIRAIVPALPWQHAINVAAALPMFALPPLVTARLSVDQAAHFYTTWLAASLFFIVSPAISWALFAEGRSRGSDLRVVAKRGALFACGLLAPLMLGFLLGAHFILGLFGPAYAAQGTPLLRILVVAAIPDAVTNLFVAVMRVENRLRAAVVMNAAMTVETLLLAWILLPPLGLAGAGWAWLIAQSTGSLSVGAYVLHRRLRHRHFASVLGSEPIPTARSGV